jgi:hypothetical protein
VREVQDVPFVEVPAFVKPYEQAKKVPPPYVMADQSVADGIVLEVQVMPSLHDVPTLLLLPATAANTPPPYAKPIQSLVADNVREVQVIPSGDVAAIAVP